MTVNTYEGMFILDANRYSRDPSSAPQQISTMMGKLGGEILASRLWDDGRKLAYPVDGHKKGTYWLTYFKLESNHLTELNRECRLNENMLRYLFLKLDSRIAPEMVRVAKGEEAPVEEAPVEEASAAESEPTPDVETTDATKPDEPSKDAD